MVHGGDKKEDSELQTGGGVVRYLGINPKKPRLNDEHYGSSWKREDEKKMI